MEVLGTEVEGDWESVGLGRFSHSARPAREENYRNEKIFNRHRTEKLDDARDESDEKSGEVEIIDVEQITLCASHRILETILCSGIEYRSTGEERRRRVSN
jgi:hypothetical protein